MESYLPKRFKRLSKSVGITHRKVKVTTYKHGKKKTYWNKIPLFPEDQRSNAVANENGSNEASTRSTQCQIEGIPDAEFPHNMDVHLTQTSSQGKTYGETRNTRTHAWEKLLPNLKSAYISTLAPPTNTCSSCGDEEDSIILCRDCGPTAFFCYNCCLRFHNIACLHVPVMWVGTTYQPVPWKKKLYLPAHDCGTFAPQDLVVIDQYGRQHDDVEIGYCACKSKAETLVTLGLWPSSPQNPTAAMDMRLMELCRCMLLEGTMAVMKFTRTVRMYASGLPNEGEHVNLYVKLSNDCTSYHRRFAYDLEYLQGMGPSFPDGTECPICKETADVLPKVISMDGNFRLVRKKNAGTSDTLPHHENHFFLKDDLVEPFLKKNPVAHDQECSAFKAGSSERSTFKSKNLATSGVFGSVCIHDQPEVFMNMQGGEKLGYAVCVINKVMQTDEQRNVKALYDVACRLLSQLKSGKINVLKLDLAVPVFHGYAHDMKCQTNYNPKNIPDFRLADGENTERLWSYIGQFVYITREMTPSNRHDLLVDALLHWGRKALAASASRMEKRLQYCTTYEMTIRTELDSILNPLKDDGIDTSDEAILGWEEKYKARYDSNQKEPNADGWKDEYAMLLNKWFAIRWKMPEIALLPEEMEAKTEMKKLEKQLKPIEKAQNVVRWTSDSSDYKAAFQHACTSAATEILGKLHRDACDRKNLVRRKTNAKNAHTAAKLSEQIKKTNSRMAKQVQHYNHLPGTMELTGASARDPDSPQYADLEPMDDIPSPNCRDAVLKFNTITRIKEEEAAIKIELPALLKWHKDQHKLLVESILTICPPANITQQGLIAKFTDQILFNESQQEVIAKIIRVKIDRNATHDDHYTKNVLVDSKSVWKRLVEMDDEEEKMENNARYHDSDDETSSDEED